MRFVSQVADESNLKNLLFTQLDSGVERPGGAVMCAAMHLQNRIVDKEKTSRIALIGVFEHLNSMHCCNFERTGIGGIENPTRNSNSYPVSQLARGGGRGGRTMRV